MRPLLPNFKMQKQKQINISVYRRTREQYPTKIQLTIISDKRTKKKATKWGCLNVFQDKPAYYFISLQSTIIPDKGKIELVLIHRIITKSNIK